MHGMASAGCHARMAGPRLRTRSLHGAGAGHFGIAIALQGRGEGNLHSSRPAGSAQGIQTQSHASGALLRTRGRSWLAGAGPSIPTRGGSSAGTQSPWGRGRCQAKPRRQALGVKGARCSHALSAGAAQKCPKAPFGDWWRRARHPRRTLGGPKSTSDPNHAVAGGSCGRATGRSGSRRLRLVPGLQHTKVSSVC